VNGVKLLGEGRAVSWSNDSHIILWDLENKEKSLFSTNQIVFKGHSKAVNGLELLDGGKRAISWSNDHNIILWNLESKNNHNNHVVFKGHNRDVLSVKLLDGEKRALSVHDNVFILWDLNNKDKKANHIVFKGHTKQVNGVEVFDGGKRALSWGSDNSVIVWDLENKDNNTNHVALPFNDMVKNHFWNPRTSKFVLLASNSISVVNATTNTLHSLSYPDFPHFDSMDCLSMDNSISVCAVGKKCLVCLEVV